MYIVDNVPILVRADNLLNISCAKYWQGQTQGGTEFIKMAQEAMHQPSNSQKITERTTQICY